MLNDYLTPIFIIGLVVSVIILYCYGKNPFSYPYFEWTFDISGKRKVDSDELIDTFINDGYFHLIPEHVKKVESWKEQCEKECESAFFKKHRKEQYLSIIDDEHEFNFHLQRDQTRYRQVNYVKHAYTVSQVCETRKFSFDELQNRYDSLKQIGFETTIKKYNSKEQRKLMTKELRSKIAKRDNYTCQICGKYMPDGVGLHIDHIVPVAKGGKSVESNLQVLCSKCNGSKSDKL